MQKGTKRKETIRHEGELSYLKDMFNVSSQQVAGALRAAGNNIKAVENYLRHKTVRLRID